MSTDTYTIKILNVYKFVFRIDDCRVYCDVYKKERYQKQYKIQYKSKQLTLPEKYRINDGVVIGEYKRELFYTSVFDNNAKKICKIAVEKSLKVDGYSLW